MQDLANRSAIGFAFIFENRDERKFIRKNRQSDKNHPPDASWRPQSFVALLVFQRESTFFFLDSAASAR